MEDTRAIGHMHLLQRVAYLATEAAESMPDTVPVGNGWPNILTEQKKEEEKSGIKAKVAR